jgi:CubicO group peptidase (beta-lactamase class C family)
VGIGVSALSLFLVPATAAVAQESTAEPEVYPPPQLNDGWATGSLTDAGTVPDSLRRLTAEIRAGTYPDVHGLLIARDARLVFEMYFHGNAYDYEAEGFRGPWTEFSSETLHNTASVTKSITGLLVGIAVDQEFIGGPDESVFSFFPEYAHLSDEQKDRITVAHLLTMTSGLKWNEQDVFYSDPENDIIKMFVARDPIEHVLAKPLIHPPASTWYNGGGVSILGEIIHRRSDKRLDTFAQEHLFSPLQISRVEWAFVKPDFVYASGDIRLRPRDMAKIGQLILNKGTWQGKRIVSAAWVEAMTRKWFPLGPSQGYGFLWWKREFPTASDSVHAVVADGWGGQRIMVFPDLNAVVVFVGGSYLQQHRLDEVVSNYILPTLGGSH